MAQATVGNGSEPTTGTTTALSRQTMTTEDAAIEKYRYKPLAKIGSVGTLKALLEAQRDALTAVMPRHLTPERLYRTLLTAINRTPDLLRCTQASIVEAVSRAGELGLDVSGTLQEAWILPFKNKLRYRDDKDVQREEWFDQATLIPGYRGLAKLARQSGEIKSLTAQTVCQNDHFEIEYGSEPRLSFRPRVDGPRGVPIGAFSCVRLQSGELTFEYMSTEDIEKIRQMSKQPNSLMWSRHWGEGARKTVFRRHAKWLPLSAEKSEPLMRAIEASDKEFDLEALAKAVDVSTAPGSRTASVIAAIAGSSAAEDAGGGEGVGDQVIDLGDAEVVDESEDTSGDVPAIGPETTSAATVSPLQRLSAEATGRLMKKAQESKVSWGAAKAEIDKLPPVEGENAHAMEDRCSEVIGFLAAEKGRK